MKFTGLEIKREFDFATKKHEFRGRISFDLETGGYMVLNLNDEYCRKYIELSIPLLERATNERIEIVKEEIAKHDK